MEALKAYLKDIKKIALLTAELLETERETIREGKWAVDILERNGLQDVGYVFSAVRRGLRTAHCKTALVRFS